MPGNALDKYPFDRIFDDDSEDGRSGRGKKEPTFSLAELEAAKEAAHAAGIAAGLESAREGYERLAAQALAEASRKMDALDLAQAESSAATRRNAVEVAVTIVRKLLPRLEARHGIAEVEQLVGECLNQLFDEPRVVIRVHESLLEVLRDRVEALAQSAGFPGRLILIADDTIGPGDCRVEWADGGAERLGDRIWRDIDAVLLRVLGTRSGSAVRWLAATGPSAGADGEATPSEASPALGAPS
jgi:flagellar assembly protein FliH